MGLAAYGTPKYKKEMYEIVKKSNDSFFQLNLKYFNHHKNNHNYMWNNEYPIVKDLFTKNFYKLFNIRNKKIDEKKKADIAASAQAVFEELLISMCNFLYNKTKSKKFNSFWWLCYEYSCQW